MLQVLEMVVGIAVSVAAALPWRFAPALGFLHFTYCLGVGAIGPHPHPKVIGPWPFPGGTSEMPEGLGSGFF